MFFNRQLLAITGGIRLGLAGQVVIGLAVTATYVGQALIMAQVLTNIFAGKEWSEVVVSLVWIAALIVVRSGLVWFREVQARTIVEKSKRNLRRRLYLHLLDLGPGYLQHTRTGEVQPLFVDKIEALDGYVGYYLPQLFITFIGCFAIGAYLLTLDPLVGLVLFVCMPFVLIAKSWWRTVLGKRGMENWQAYTGVKSDFIDSMQGMTTLKAFGASAQQGHNLEKKTQTLYQATMGLMGASMWGNSIMGLAVTGGTALAVSIGAYHLSQGQLTVSQLLIILFLSSEAFRPLADLARYWHASYAAGAAWEGLSNLFDTKPEIETASIANTNATVIVEDLSPESDPASSPVASPQSPPGIMFDGVGFAYQGRSQQAVRDLSFEMAPGETVALVGRSGAGKSTIVSLLLRFFDPNQGQVTLGGKNLKDYDLKTLRANIAVVSQDTYLFYGTIAENLRLAKPHATEQELDQAAQAANALDFIRALPQGYETIIGERGVKLSGGERQRIAIARALLKDAPVLILDEATSSIDGASEATIQEALERLMAGRTTLLIAHRLSTVVNADRIIVLENGQVIEAGGHAELVARQTAYARLVAAQKEML